MSSKKPYCFVIMPFGKLDTPERKKYDTVYELIIKKPILDEGFECVRGDEIPSYGPIPEQLKKELAEADLVIADLSGRNPNVFYELGYRHAMGDPCISISDDPEGLPFNVKTYRTIQYKLDDLRLVEHCRETIRNYACQVRESQQRKLELPQEPVEVATDRLEKNLNVGLSNIYQMLGELMPKITSQADLHIELNDLQRRVDDQRNSLAAIQNGLSNIADIQRSIGQTLELGLVSIYPNRLEAIENEFYNIMKEEEEGISIVGSTMYGLRGFRAVTLGKIVSLLQQKASQPTFRLRILLTHWDYISSRQLQERTDKNVARYVISKELMEAVTLLREKRLDQYVRFYRGSPTCSTIVCEGQKRMLVNPYPYESEAINSWTVTFRDGDIYSRFKVSHVDKPWDNPKLSVPFTPELEEEVIDRFRQDVQLARDDMSQELGIPHGN